MSCIDRPPHTLIKEKTLAIPRHIVFFDTETTQSKTPDDDIEHHLKLGWACYYRPAERRRAETLEWFYFTEVEPFWSWLFAHIPTKTRLWVIAHQMAFDFTVMEGFARLQANKYKLKFFHSAGPTTIISVRKPGKSLLFVDNLNWFAASLQAIGERLDLPKLKVDFDSVNVSDLKVYCKRDVEILLQMFKQFVKFLFGNRISRLCYTIGSTAMAAYLFGGYGHTIFIHNNAEAIALERDSYRGGRTECFHLGELKDGPYYLLDVNSLYPYVMRQFVYPVKYKKICHSPEPQRLFSALRAGTAIAEVTVTVDEPVFGVRRDRLIFPIGTFRVTLCTPELLYALERDWVKSVGLCVFYESAPIFTKYVDKFYALRKDFASAGVPLYAHFIKLLLNSLYGKFGQKCDVWEKIGEDDTTNARIEMCYDLVTHKRYKVRFLLGEVYESRSQTESFNSFPAIASHVTAYARLHLWQLIKTAGRGHCFYCDTDSVLVDQVGFDNLTDHIDAAKIGALKLEHTLPSIIIRGAKDYIFPGHERLKGISKNAEKVSDTEYNQQHWPSLRGMLSRGETKTYKVKQITKHLNRQYIKGIVCPDGSIAPLQLSVVD